MSGTLHAVRTARVLRGLCGVAALLGLFAMHGLARHGTAHHEPLIQPVVTVMAPDGAGVMVMDHAIEGTEGIVHGGAPASDPGLLAMVGLCLAVLLGGVAVAVLLGRRSTYPGPRDGSVADAWRPTRARRDRDPPCLLTLSIQRC